MNTSRSLVQMVIVFAILTAASAAMAFDLDPQAVGRLSHLAPHAGQLIQKQKTEDPAADVPAARIYESAQGPIDLGKFERVISNYLRETPVTIENIRWPYNPFAYSNYFVGKMFHDHAGYENTWFATYVLTMKVAQEHEAVCEFTIYIKEPRATLWNCRSSTAKVKVYLDLKHKDIGLPVLNDGKPEISNKAVTGPQ